MSRYRSGLAPIAEHLSRPGLALLFAVGAMYFFYGRAVFFPFVALALAPLVSRARPGVVAPFVEAAMLGLGQAALLAFELAREPSAREGAAGVINLVDIALLLGFAALLVWRGWRLVAGALAAWHLVGLLPLAPLAAMNFGTPDGWVYMAHTILRGGAIALVIAGFLAARAGREAARAPGEREAG